MYSHESEIKQEEEVKKGTEGKVLKAEQKEFPVSQQVAPDRRAAPHEL